MKKYVKYVLLLLVLWLAFDWIHLSGQEIEKVSGWQEDFTVSVWRQYYYGEFPYKNGEERYTLTGEQADAFRALLEDTHCRRTLSQGTVTKPQWNGFKPDEDILEYDLYIIGVGFGDGTEQLRLDTIWGDYLSFNSGPRYKIMTDDWNIRMAEILRIE